VHWWAWVWGFIRERVGWVRGGASMEVLFSGPPVNPVFGRVRVNTIWEFVGGKDRDALGVSLGGCGKTSALS